MMIKKEDRNTGVSNGVKKFLIKNLIKNFKKMPYPGTQLTA